jgi:hypothetical protein
VVRSAACYARPTRHRTAHPSRPEYARHSTQHVSQHASQHTARITARVTARSTAQHAARRSHHDGVARVAVPGRAGVVQPAAGGARGAGLEGWERGGKGRRQRCMRGLQVRGGRGGRWEGRGVASSAHACEQDAPRVAGDGACRACVQGHDGRVCGHHTTQPGSRNTTQDTRAGASLRPAHPVLTVQPVHCSHTARRSPPHSSAWVVRPGALRLGLWRQRGLHQAWAGRVGKGRTRTRTHTGRVIHKGGHRGPDAARPWQRGPDVTWGHGAACVCVCAARTRTRSVSYTARAAHLRLPGWRPAGSACRTAARGSSRKERQGGNERG